MIQNITYNNIKFNNGDISINIVKIKLKDYQELYLLMKEII